MKKRDRGVLGKEYNHVQRSDMFNELGMIRFAFFKSYSEAT